jgi:DNA invertase Pin-like site-specific DNA recombinase
MENQDTQGTRAIGYIRVSTDKQADYGVSLPAQREKIQAMCVVHGLSLVEVITDAESAKDLDRPGLARLLKLVDSRAVDTIIITKLDRLTRSVRDLADLLERFQKRGVSLISMSESLDTASAAGRLVLNIMASVSQWEREAIGERTSTALRHKKAHLQVFNHDPYGFMKQGNRLVPVAAEQATIERIRLWRANGRTLEAIAVDLNEQGVPTKRSGGKWYARTIKNLLESSMHQAA